MMAESSAQSVADGCEMPRNIFKSSLIAVLKNKPREILTELIFNNL